MTPAPVLENDGSAAVQEHPEELQTQESAPAYGIRNEELPDQLVKLLRATVVEFMGQEKYLRRREVIRDGRNRFYERGYQHIVWNSAAGGNSGGFAQITAGGVVTSPGGISVQAPNYVDDYNIFQPYLRIIEAILTQNAPGIDFQPIDPNRSADVEAAETAEAYRHQFNRSNDVKAIQTDIVRMMGLGSRCILWTRTEANEEKFGKNANGEPKQMETTSVYGTLESRVSIIAKCPEDFLYVFLFDDPDIRKAKAEYPFIAKKIKAGDTVPGENAYERYARLGVMQGTRSEQTGESYTHVATRMHCFLRPAAFTGEEYDKPFEEPQDGDINEDGTAITCKEKLDQLFPTGCHVVFMGDNYAGSWDESMDDAIKIAYPYSGDGQFRLAIMDPMVVCQDAFNDAMNAAREVFDIGWPSTWINAEDAEYDAITSQRSDPYAIRQKKVVGPAAKMSDQFFREPNPELPATFITYLEMVQGNLAQFMLACPPALQGAAMEDQKTASGYAQARAQAMGQLGLIWGAIQALMAGMYYQAALCASTNPDHAEEIVVPTPNGSASMQLQKLSKGHFGAYPDEDSSFPESTSAKRQTLASMLMQLGPTPVGQQIMSAPDNWKTFSVTNGFPELILPEAEARDAQQIEIEELLLQAPMGPPPQEVAQAQQAHAQVTLLAEQGQAPMPPPWDPATLPKSPSVPVNPWDFDNWHIAKCDDWLNSGACRRQIANGNMAGVQNVWLHRMAHVEAQAAKAPPPPMPPPIIPPQAKPGGPPAGLDTPPAAPSMATM